jgi:M6 family metalloprotease-like protein
MKKTVTLFVLIYLAVGCLVAAPLKNVPQVLKQPDGTIINCFASGDEYYHWLHDKDGYTITFNKESKYWVYAERKGMELVATNLVVGKTVPSSAGLDKWLKPDWQLLKQNYEKVNAAANRKSLYKTMDNGVLSKGTMINIIVFVRFADQSEFENPLSTYKEKFEGTTASSLSLKTYYESVSYNQFHCQAAYYPTPDGDKVVSVKDLHVRDYYRKKEVAPDSGYATSEEGSARMAKLHARAVSAIKGLVPGNLIIDSNGDSKVDNVVFVMKGSPEGWGEVLWPVQGSFDFEDQINGKTLGVYNQQYDAEMNVSVICHEVFHTLGAPDLYHYKTEQKRLTPVGTWDLMESDGNQNMVAYMKYKYGKWINTFPEVKSSGTYTLNPLGGSDSTNVAYKINSPNSTNEYFMIEYRNKILPFETNIPSSGVIIYRVNKLADGKGNADFPDNPDEVYIYRPGGTTVENGVLESAGFTPDSNRTSFNESTNPSCFLSDGKAGGIKISGIKIDGKTASFTIDLGDGLVGVDNEKTIPGEFSLSQNYPNPFNPTTIINYRIASASNVSLKIYDVLGREIMNLVDGYLQPGSYNVQFSAIGNQLSSGIYFYTLKAGNFVETKKMLLLK